jgi:hypothetical protein
MVMGLLLGVFDCVGLLLKGTRGLCEQNAL